MNLSKIKVGERAVIEAFSGPAEIVERMREMGLRPGLEVGLLQRSPLRGPLVLAVSNTVMALRLEEAECVSVEALK